MRGVGLTILLASTLACATAATFHGGRTALTTGEKPLLVSAAKGQPGGFSKIWRRAGQGTPGLLKWSPDSSCPQVGALPEILQSIRDEVGRLNQLARAGAPAFVSVTVYRHRTRWWGPNELSYELVVRDGKAQLLWAADDTVQASRAAARSLADSEAELFARAIALKVGKELGL